MRRRGTDEVRRATRRLVAAQTAAFAASGVGVGLAPLPLSGDGAHGSWAGAMLAVLGLAAGAGALVGGRLMDRGDPRRRLAAAHAVYALAGLGAAAAAAARSPGWLLAAAALAGAGQGAALLGRVAVAALHASCRRGRALGRMLTIGAVGAAAGPVAVAGAQELAERTGLDPLALPWLALPALGALGVWAVIGADRETPLVARRARPGRPAGRARAPAGRRGTAGRRSPSRRPRSRWWPSWRSRPRPSGATPAAAPRWPSPSPSTSSACTASPRRSAG